MSRQQSKRFRDLSRRRPPRLPRIPHTVLKELGSNGNAIGKAREKFAFDALSEDSSKLPHWIKKVAYGTLDEDKRGIDLVVETDAGKIFLQVKGTRQAAKEFHEQRPNSDIQVVIIKLDKSIEIVRSQILSVIGKERRRIRDLQSVQ